MGTPPATGVLVCLCTSTDVANVCMVCGICTVLYLVMIKWTAIKEIKTYIESEVPVHDWKGFVILTVNIWHQNCHGFTGSMLSSSFVHSSEEQLLN